MEIEECTTPSEGDVWDVHEPETVESLRAANAKLEALVEQQHTRLKEQEMALFKAAAELRAKDTTNGFEKVSLRAANRRLRDQIETHRAAVVAIAMCISDESEEE
jgi:hypothetical protein